MSNKLPFYLLMAFIIGTIIYIFAAPIFIIDKIEKDSKRPTNERVYKIHN